jgi:hypothetical protein
MRIQLKYFTTLLVTAGAAVAVAGAPEAPAEPLQTICAATIAGDICRSTGNDVPNALPTVSSHPYGNLPPALSGRL